MKIIKLITVLVGTIALVALSFVGVKVGTAYYKSHKMLKSLEESPLNYDITTSDIEKGRSLKNGQILLKKRINLEEIPPIYEKVSENGIFKDKYQHLKDVHFYSLVYKSDQKLVNGIVALPAKEGKYPTIIFNRGGNLEKGNAAKVKVLFSIIGMSKLVESGNILIGSCYREEDEFGGKDINDVLSLTNTIKEIKEADSERIGMIGWSRGGMMTYLALQKSKEIKTAVIGNAPTNLFTLIEDRPEMQSKVCAQLIPNYEVNKEIELKKRSAIFWADELNENSSLLLLCSTNDKKVKPQHAKDIAQKLKELDYNFELREFDTDHHFTNKTDELVDELVVWFDNELNKG